MSAVRVRIGEGNEPQVNYLWDSRWRPTEGAADWAIAGPDETRNRGGLSARAALHSSIVLCLFTDKRIPNDHPLIKLLDDGDQRGWWGDGADVRTDLDETELGSLLWIFERSFLSEEIRRWVEAIASEALSPLIAQGAAVRIDCQAEMQPTQNRINLAVQVYGRENTKIYDVRFDDIWKQAATSPEPPPFPDYPPVS
jgi:phage gp46-like protein